MFLQRDGDIPDVGPFHTGKINIGRPAINLEVKHRSLYYEGMEETPYKPREQYSIGKSAAFTTLYLMFLSLFLLLFTFFAMLNSISSKDKTKARNAMASVTEIFAPEEPSAIIRQPDGADVSIASFSEDLKQITSTLVNNDNLAFANKGDTVVIHMPSSYLFAPGRSDLRGDNLVYLQQMALSLRTWLKGYRIDIECVAGYPNGGLDSSLRLEIARVGSLARYLVSEGITPRSVSTGLQEGDADNITFRFTLRHEAAPGGTS